jgi:hypothetical protein
MSLPDAACRVTKFFTRQPQEAAEDTDHTTLMAQADGERAIDLKIHSLDAVLGDSLWCEWHSYHGTQQLSTRRQTSEAKG